MLCFSIGPGEGDREGTAKIHLLIFVTLMNLFLIVVPFIRSGNAAKL